MNEDFEAGYGVCHVFVHGPDCLVRFLAHIGDLEFWVSPLASTLIVIMFF